jgi:hypothetical protein
MTHFTTPPFEPEKYRKYLENVEWSDEKKDEWLRVLWEVVIQLLDESWNTVIAEAPSPSAGIAQPQVHGEYHPSDTDSSLAAGQGDSNPATPT